MLSIFYATVVLWSLSYWKKVFHIFWDREAVLKFALYVLCSYLILYLKILTFKRLLLTFIISTKTKHNTWFISIRMNQYQFFFWERCFTCFVEWHMQFYIKTWYYFEIDISLLKTTEEHWKYIFLLALA